jgi:predicted FMN-binding regulatory protein PaiB
VSIPLAYLEVAFNAERNPCRTHQLYYSVIIRGMARIVPDGELKTAALNALLAKHEGNRDFPAVAPDSPDNRACCVVEIKPEKMTAKSDLAQNRPPEARRFIAENLAKRGLPGDLEAVRTMGFDLEGGKGKGWRLKG